MFKSPTNLVGGQFEKTRSAVGEFGFEVEIGRRRIISVESRFGLLARDRGETVEGGVDGAAESA